MTGMLAATVYRQHTHVKYIENFRFRVQMSIAALKVVLSLYRSKGNKEICPHVGRTTFIESYEDHIPLDVSITISSLTELQAASQAVRTPLHL